MGLVGLRCFVKKVLSFAESTGKHLCWRLLLDKVATWRSANFLLEDTPAAVFSCAFCEIFKNTYFVRQLHAFITMLCLSFFGWIIKRVFKNTIFYIESIIHLLFFRSSRSQMFYKIVVLNNFAKVKENNCAGVSVLVKLQASRREIYWESDSGTDVFPWIL